MPTPRHIILIQTAKRALKLDDASYRMILRNAGKVTSSKQLDNRGVEAVMAVLEEMGFQNHKDGPTYWRDKAARSQAGTGERVIHKIHALAAGQPYDLAALAYRFSNHRTNQVEQLGAQESYALIEMLKQVHQRQHPSPARACEVPAAAAAAADNPHGGEVGNEPDDEDDLPF